MLPGCGGVAGRARWGARVTDAGGTPARRRPTRRRGRGKPPPPNAGARNPRAAPPADCCQAAQLSGGRWRQSGKGPGPAARDRRERAPGPLLRPQAPMHMPAAQIRRGPGGTRPRKLGAAAHRRQSGPAAYKRPRRVCTNLEGRRSAGGGRGGHGSAGFAKSTLQATREESQQERASPKQPWMRAGGRSSADAKGFLLRRAAAPRGGRMGVEWGGTAFVLMHLLDVCQDYSCTLMHVCTCVECRSIARAARGGSLGQAPPSGAPPWVRCVWVELNYSASVVLCGWATDSCMGNTQPAG